MLQDDKPEGAVSVGATGQARESGADKRRAARRKLPFGRGAVLDVSGRSHIVGLADVSVTGAYLTTRAPVSVGETHRLRLLILPNRTEVVLSARVVRISQAAGESSDHPRGVAVQFVDLDEDSRRRLDAFVTRQLKKSPRS
jgi:Tfp pilus assembly protein PilZ